MGLPPLAALNEFGNNPAGVDFPSYSSPFPSPEEAAQVLQQSMGGLTEPNTTVPGQGSAGSVSTGSTPPGTPGALSGIGSGIKSVVGSVIGSLFAIDTQAVTILIGLILIAGGIFLFKPVQQVVVKTAKEAAKASAVAA